MGLNQAFEGVLEDTVTILGSQSRLRAARQRSPLLIEPCISQKWAQSSKRLCCVCVSRKKCSLHEQTKQQSFINTFIYFHSRSVPSATLDITQLGEGSFFLMRESIPLILGPTGDVLPICDASPVIHPDVPVVS